MLQNGGRGDIQSRSCKKSHTLARLLRSCGIHMDYGGSKILKNQRLLIENLQKGILSLFGKEVQIEVIITKSFVCKGKAEKQDEGGGRSQMAIQRVGYFCPGFNYIYQHSIFVVDIFSTGKIILQAQPHWTQRRQRYKIYMRAAFDLGSLTNSA